MANFIDGKPALDTYWRAVILFGRNVASYKFALAKSLIELVAEQKDFVTLEELAVPFSKNIAEHLRIAPKQATSSSSRFLDACRKFNTGEIDRDKLIAQTAALGFNNVIDAFHIVNRGEIPVRFFVDERQGAQTGIRLTDQLFNLAENRQFANLPHETEARWRLVETAWELNLPRGLVVGTENDGNTLYTVRRERRIAITRSRDALNGYQKGKCFYCFSEVSIDPAVDLLADVDHFFPRVLLQLGVNQSLDGVWNLVLACRHCNRGIAGKSSLLPSKSLLERLNTRNEFLISSHHPLRETLIAQTGASPALRTAFLNSVFDNALERLIHIWEPKLRADTAF